MLVDDHQMVATALREILEAQDKVQIVAVESNAADALRKLELLSVDVLVVDISLSVPGQDGLWLVQKAKERLPHLPVLVLTMHSEHEVLLKALELGVSGYIIKSSTHEELKQALRTVGAGGTYIQPQMARGVFDALRINGKRHSEVESLQISQRELEVLQLAAAGLRNQEIARTLNLSVSTVKTYFRSLYRKLEVTDRTQAVVTALNRNLISRPSLS